MKFGRHLDSNMLPQWKEHYVNYSKLKKMLKAMPQNEAASTIAANPVGNSYMNPSISRHEAEFGNELDAEIEKINQFTKNKAKEIRERTQRLVTLSSKTGLTETQKQDLKQDAEECEQVLLQLEKYVSLNVTAFVKILKKHDKNSPVKYTQVYIMRIWKQPFLTDKLDSVVVTLSKIHEKLRGPSEHAKKKQGEAAQNFVRKTTKYWVRMEHVTEVKVRILKELPVLQFKESSSDAQLTSSVYFDNAAMELYYGRITKREGAIAFRIRWYGDGDPDDVFMERKTHRDSWAGEISVKTRFSMKEKHVVDYLNGQYTLHEKAEQMRKKGSKEEEVQEMLTLADEIQRAVETKQLVPTVRTVYMRTAFQLPDNATVRISIDTNLMMIRERCKQGEWRRDPKKPIPEEDITRFPFAVLEVKLQLELGEQAPSWVTDLINSGMLIEAHKFSKFIHGCVMLIPEQVPALPHWLDALREYTAKKPLDAPTKGSKKGASKDKRSAPQPSSSEAFMSGSGSPFVDARGSTSRRSKTKEVMMQPRETSDSEDTSEHSALLPRRTHGAHASSAMHGSSHGSSHGPSHGPSHGSSHKQLRTAHESDDDTHSHGSDAQGYDYPHHDADCCECCPSFLNLCRPVRNRSTKVPLRVEPKTFFANERTFLSWLNMSLTISILALGLVGFADDLGMQIAGIILLSTGVLFSLYAYFVFVRRAQKIRAREDGPYDDVIGPGVLLFVINAAIVASLLAAVIFGDQEQA